MLALWRLLRAWEVRPAGPALTVSLVFLLTAVEPAGAAAAIGHLPGNFFVARAWQGKAILAAVLVPLLFSLLHDTRRGRGARARAAGRRRRGGGRPLTTATFLVPVIAFACLVPLAPGRRRGHRRGRRRCAYPVAAMAAALSRTGGSPSAGGRPTCTGGARCCPPWAPAWWGSSPVSPRSPARCCYSSRARRGTAAAARPCAAVRAGPRRSSTS